MPKSTSLRGKAADHTALSPGALSVLRHKLRIEGFDVRLTEELERTLYEEVDELLTRLGGTYVALARKHAFPYDPGPHIEATLHCGEMPEKNPLAFFYTPDSVLGSIRWMLDPQRNDRMHRLRYWQQDRGRLFRILEPSAGLGHMAELLRDLFPEAIIECCELDPYRRGVLQAKGFSVVAEDFLDYCPQHRFDLIVMNPPFSLGSDSDTYIKHIYRAMELLVDEEESELIAIAPNGFTFDARPIYYDFFTFALEHGVLERLPADAFKESGTTIQTVLLWLGKRRLPDFCDLDEPWWGYPNRRVGRLLEWVHMEADYYERLERLLERMTSGNLTVYSNGRPAPDARAAINRFCNDVVERARPDFNHFPLLPTDFDLLVEEVMEQYEDGYAYRLEGLRRQHEAQKQRRLKRAQDAIDQNRAAIARTSARIEELEQAIVRRAADEPRLIAAHHELAAQTAVEPDFVPPVRPDAPGPPPPRTLFDLLDASA